MMKMTLTYNDFERAFRDYDRYKDFGRDALEALWEYLEEYEESTGEEIELDVLALCCDYGAYDYLNIAEEFDDLVEREEYEEYEDYTERVLEELERTTSVIRYPGGAVIGTF